MDYTLFNAKHQKDALKGRILQKEADHFALSRDIVNLQAIDTDPNVELDSAQAQIEEKETIMARLEVAHAEDIQALKEIEDQEADEDD